MSHFRHRPDSNTDEIVNALEKLGLTVWKLNDVVDLLIGYGGYTRLGEVRPAGKPAKPREGRQKRFHDSWTGGVYWLQTVDDCIACAKSMKQHVQWIQSGALSVVRG
jgi:hypothetical protein